MSTPRPQPPLPVASATGCPCVSDLIQFALGLGDRREREYIDSHLNAAQCSHCRSWVEKAAHTAGKSEAGAVERKPSAGVRTRGAVAPAAQAGPSWRNLAFRDLERQLSQLEETNPEGQ